MKSFVIPRKEAEKIHQSLYERCKRELSKLKRWRAYSRKRR